MNKKVLFNERSEVNGHGYFRKSKAYGLVCGIALGLAFLGGHVSADEVTVAQDTETSQSVLTIQDSTVVQTDVSPSVTTSVGEETPATDTTSPATDEVVETPKEDTTSSDVTGSTGEVVETPKEETNIQLPEATTPEQGKINQTVENTKDILGDAGVKVEVNGENHYTDSNQAQADADKQKAEVEKFAETQKALDEAIKQAQELAQKAGLTVTLKPTTVTSIEEAKAKLAEVQKLIEDATNKLIADKKTEAEANKLIEEAKKKAEEAGVIITTAEKQNYDKADDALADAEAQKQKLEEIINAQNGVNKQLQDLMASLNAVTQTITGNKVTVSSIEEANKKLAEIKAKIQEIDKKNAELKAAYDAEVQKVNEHNAQLKADYEKKLAQYEAAKADYDKKLAEYEANKGKDGYLNNTYTQGLIFKSEADAHVTIVKSDGSVIANNSTDPNNGTDSYRVVLHKGESVTVTYTNLKNSYYNGVKIDKVVYVYTAKDAVNGLYINQNPNITVMIMSSDFDTADKNGEQNGSQSSHIGMSIQFFDEKGQVITFNEKNPALIAFNSLNKTQKYTGSGYGESIHNLSSNIKIETIAGSSVIYKDGVLYAGNYNDYVSNGSRFDANPATDPNNYWDGATQANRWYGAAVGVVSSGDTISFDIVMDAGADAKRHEYGKFWFAFSSDVAAPVLTLPTPPEAPNYEKEPTAPDYQKVDVPTIQIETAVHEVGVNKTTEMEVETPQLEMDMHTVAYDKPATPEAPEVVKSSVLPMTGDETSPASILASVAGIFMTLAGLVGVRKRKEN